VTRRRPLPKLKVKVNLCLARHTAAAHGALSRKIDVPNHPD
jgi:hypothetical protein